ncbi:MAG: 1-(5-phosphoribosyl)-5-[(5-phosphoribosylamino)methylideneamino] imidazole-4-carboxamide isomerase [Candidatus Omnitrophota bacterium]
MLIIPAIDIIGNRLVRLTRGNYGEVTDYNLEPLRILREYASAGAKRIHLVFLSAAREGTRGSEETTLLNRILDEKRSLNIEIELGGGIRTMNEIKKVLQRGTDYVILGTSAILDALKILEEHTAMGYTKSLASFLNEVSLPFPSILQEIVRERISEKTIISIDCKEEAVAVSGWEVTLPPQPIVLFQAFQAMGFRQIIYTSTDRDGTLSGPDVDRIKMFADSVPEVSFLMAGGIGGMKDIRTLNRLGIPNLKGVIIGKALYEGKIDLRETISQFQ